MILFYCIIKFWENSKRYCCHVIMATYPLQHLNITTKIFCISYKKLRKKKKIIVHMSYYTAVKCKFGWLQPYKLIAGHSNSLHLKCTANDLNYSNISSFMKLTDMCGSDQRQRTKITTGKKTSAAHKPSERGQLIKTHVMCNISECSIVATMEFINNYYCKIINQKLVQMYDDKQQNSLRI